ncbi:hypothetical protein LJC34_05110 [Oscillospiraceae bacterium OttesenSCG-928-G22]|nr:hypothetical protein [Oscillospiraceae bacterium OttesenSCG-928-G22]
MTGKIFKNRRMQKPLALFVALLLLLSLVVPFTTLAVDVVQNLYGEGVSPSEITLTWEPVSGATNYSVYRSHYDGGYTYVATATTAAFSDLGLTADTVYYYRVIVGSDDSTEAKTSVKTLAYELTLTAAALGVDTIRLDWTFNDTAPGYEVYYSMSESGPYAPVKSAVLGTNYLIDNLSPNSTYHFKISALTTPGVDSNVASATTFPNLSLTATALNESSIELNWSPQVPAATYNIYRSTANSGPFSFVGTASDSLKFLNAGLTASTTYWYYITATSGQTLLVTSNTASATTAVGAPTGFNAEAKSQSSNYLSWNAVPGAVSYPVYRKLSGSVNPFELVATAIDTNYTDTGLTHSTEYEYYIIGVNSGGGESAPSATSTATTYSNLTAEAESRSSIKLTWGAVTDADTYSLYRSITQNGTYVLIGDGIAALTYTDTGLGANTTYYYQLRTYDDLNTESTRNDDYTAWSYAAGEYAPSNIASAETRSGGNGGIVTNPPSTPEPTPTSVPSATPSGEPTEVPPATPTPTPTDRPAVYPPDPSPGTTYRPIENGGYEVIDEDGTPLGAWTLNEEGEWIFEAAPPLGGLPDAGGFSLLFVGLPGVALIGTGIFLNRRQKKGKRVK